MPQARGCVHTRAAMPASDIKSLCNLFVPVTRQGMFEQALQVLLPFCLGQR